MPDLRKDTFNNRNTGYPHSVILFFLAFIRGKIRKKYGERNKEYRDGNDEGRSHTRPKSTDD